MTPSKTPFAGLEVLEPGDPLSSDGFYFQFRNPQIIDALLRLGAVLHRHDGHAALANPATAPVLASDIAGGSIPSGLPIYVTYTLVDAGGGETLPVDTTYITTTDGYADPDAGPAAVVDYAAGALLVSNLDYALTVTDGAGGETVLGPNTSVTIEPGHANAEVTLSGFTTIVDDASLSDPAAGWRLWRRQDGGAWYLIATGTAATDGFLDDGVAGDCTVEPPIVSTTSGAHTLKVTVPSAGQPAGAASFNLYASLDGSFTSPALLGNFPVADYDAVQTFTDLSTMLDGSPPARSLSIPGAQKIDALTDIVNLARAAGTRPSSQPAAGAYQFQLTDIGTTVESTNAGAVTYTIPAHATTPFPVDAEIEVLQDGAGQVTIAGAAGVTLRSRGGLLHTNGQYALIRLRQRALDEWVLSGDRA